MVAVAVTIGFSIVRVFARSHRGSCLSRCRLRSVGARCARRKTRCAWLARSLRACDELDLSVTIAQGAEFSCGPGASSSLSMARATSCWSCCVTLLREHIPMCKLSPVVPMGLSPCPSTLSSCAASCRCVAMTCNQQGTSHDVLCCAATANLYPTFLGLPPRREPSSVRAHAQARCWPWRRCTRRWPPA